MEEKEEENKAAIAVMKLSITSAFRRKPGISVYHLFLESFPRLIRACFLLLFCELNHASSEDTLKFYVLAPEHDDF